MTTFKGEHANIVLVGKHNPQILNHDFLVQNNVLPLDVEPFASLLGIDHESILVGESPYSEFISTPVVSSIRYGPVTIIVNPQRFQIQDNAYFNDPAGTSIASLTRRYFGDLLKFTPLEACGVNFSGLLEFESTADELAFDARLGIDRATIQKWAGESERLRVGVQVSQRRKLHAVEFQVLKPRDLADKGQLNANYESKLSSVADMVACVDGVDDFHRDLLKLLQQLEVEVIP
jgi:hypothetical protein